MSVTPKRGFQLPDFNTPNWDVLINGNFALADADVPLVAQFDAAVQAAAITGQALINSVTAGLFRVSYVAVVTRAATTSSSINVSVGYTDADSGVATVLTATAQAGNTVGALLQGSFVVSALNGVNIVGNTIYASSGGTTMQYAVHFRVEQL